MAAPTLNLSSSPRRSTRKRALPILTASTVPPLSPFSEAKRPNLTPNVPNAFSSIQNSSIERELKMDSTNVGALHQSVGFTKEQFEALCDKQRDQMKMQGKTVKGSSGALRTPSQVVEMSWSPRNEQNMELADEVHEWIEFLPYGDGTRKTGLEGKDNMALALCKWILTTRSQNASGQWEYVDRQATKEEILTFKEKGWPWYR